MITKEGTSHLGFINDIALAVIAFAAGSELFLEEIRPRLKTILRITAGIVIATFLIVSTAFYFLSSHIPFDFKVGPNADELPQTIHFIAISCIVGAIMVARSPSSAIAIVRELRAKGPFTQMVLSVTMISDVVVIVLFSVCSEAAGAIFSSIDFNWKFILLLAVEICGSILYGVLIWLLINVIFKIPNQKIKTALLLGLGWSVFAFSHWFREYTEHAWQFEIFMEPLLICMVGGLLITNKSEHRTEFAKCIHDIGPPIYTAFFVLTGATLDLDVLQKTWFVAVIICGIRLFTIFIGSYTGGMLGGDPPLHNRVSWMALVTQAGVGIGLATGIAKEFPDWGEQIMTVIISVIVVNQLVGPPLFKWAISMVKESHLRAEHREFDGVRDALIFGSGGGQSVALARQLIAHDWEAKVVIKKSKDTESMTSNDVDIFEVDKIDLDLLNRLQAADADAVVALLSDEENLEICELVYEHFGIETVVVRLHDRNNLEKFQELNTLIVDPSTAMISLLEHFVRSPAATSILLGTDPEQDVIEVEVMDPNLDGVALRSLNLPHDTLVLGVSRDGHTLISHGYTRLKMGDHVTIVGAPDDLDAVMLMFDK